MSFVPGGKLESRISYGIDPNKYYDNDKSYRRHSCYRWWRGLTQVQKLILILLCVTLLGLFYVFFHATRVPIAALEADLEHHPHPDHDVAPLNNPRKINREAYEQSLHKQLDEKIKALKRKPVYLRNNDDEKYN